MNLPKFSVVTPSFNQGQFIEETIQSVLHQNYPNLEYIVIDGGSTDNTLDILRKYEDRITYWTSEKDSGQSEAINKGFRKATGDILCWINSDDVLLPGALQEVADYFQRNGDMDVVNGTTLVMDQASRIMFPLFMLRQKKWYAERGIYYISQPSLFWRKKVIDSLGFLREDLHSFMDKEFLVRMFNHHLQIGQLERCLAGFRVHDSSKTFLGKNRSSGAKEKKQIQHDNQVIGELYGLQYTQHPSPLSTLLYRIEKFSRGIYLRSLVFTLRWKGKPIAEFSKKNTAHS